MTSQGHVAATGVLPTPTTKQVAYDVVRFDLGIGFHVTEHRGGRRR
jgi:hypothetical protein